MRRFLKLKPKLYLTYDNSDLMDGVGAQLQRIISVYCISKLSKTFYLHSGLIKIDSQAFLGKDAQQLEAEILQWNQIFRQDLETSTEFETDRIILLKSPSLFKLRLLSFISRVSPNRVICKIRNPRIIADKHPDCLFFAQDIFDEKKIEGKATNVDNGLSVVVHIRQGVLVLSQFRHRLLPLSHFEGILERLTLLIEEAGMRFEILIPRENRQKELIPISDPIIVRSLELDSTNTNLDFSTPGFVSLIHEEPSLIAHPTLFGGTWLPEDSVYGDFLKMIQADILIISKSSLSFVAGLLNRDSLKLYTPFWHNPPSSWIDVTDLDSFSCKEAISIWLLEIKVRKDKSQEVLGG
jgi:hypothetical protein